MHLSELGVFFALQHRDDDAGWRPLRDLCNGPTLEERVDHVSSFLAQMTTTQVEPRVAASTMSLGLFARLVAPVLGASVLDRQMPPLSLDDTYWRPTVGGPWPLALTGPESTPDVSRTLDEVVFPLADVIARRYSLSEQILRGNVASGVFGAIRMIGQARADLAASALALGRALLAGPLAGTGAVGDQFVRSSCCLYYRIPGGGYCGDCVLAHR